MENIKDDVRQKKRSSYSHRFLADHSLINSKEEEHLGHMDIHIHDEDESDLGFGGDMQSSIHLRTVSIGIEKKFFHLLFCENAKYFKLQNKQKHK